MIKELFYKILTLCALHHMFRRLNKHKILIVMYHGIIETPLKPCCWWQLPYSMFSWQLTYLKRHYTIMPLKEVVRSLRSNAALPDNVAVITFDDGYRNNYTSAYPALRERNIPATIFLTTDYIDNNRFLWPDDLYVLFMNTKKSALDLRDKKMKVYTLRTREQRTHAYNDVLNTLKNMSAESKEAIMIHIREQLGGEDTASSAYDPFRLLVWSQIREMEASGLVSYGAHSARHEILARLNDDEMRHEIESSCAAIKEHFQTSEVLFAYPNGRRDDFNEQSKNVLQEHNAICGLTTISGLNDVGTDVYELRRIGVGCDMTRSRFKLLTSGCMDWMRSL